MIPALLSWSGKDAAWTLHALRQRGEFGVVGLLSTITDEYERISMQGIRVDVLQAQAAAAGLPVIEARIPRHADNDAYIASFTDALQRAQMRWPGIDRIAFGDLFLADIRAWREALCGSLGWTTLFPLFGSDFTAALAREMIDGGLRANLCCVDTTQARRGLRRPRVRPGLGVQRAAGRHRSLRRERRVPYLRARRTDVRPPARHRARGHRAARPALRLRRLPAGLRLSRAARRRGGRRARR